MAKLPLPAAQPLHSTSVKNCRPSPERFLSMNPFHMVLVHLSLSVSLPSSMAIATASCTSQPGSKDRSVSAQFRYSGIGRILQCFWTQPIAGETVKHEPDLGSSSPAIPAFQCRSMVAKVEQLAEHNPDWPRTLGVGNLGELSGGGARGGGGSGGRGGRGGG